MLPGRVLGLSKPPPSPCTRRASRSGSYTVLLLDETDGREEWSVSLISEPRPARHELHTQLATTTRLCVISHLFSTFYKGLTAAFVADTSQCSASPATASTVVSPRSYDRRRVAHLRRNRGDLVPWPCPARCELPARRRVPPLAPRNTRPRPALSCRRSATPTGEVDPERVRRPRRRPRSSTSGGSSVGLRPGDERCEMRSVFGHV